ncbi:MAG: lysophospholipase [Bacteroidota bacterium]
MTTNEFSWTTPDQLKIYAKEWKVAFPKAVIALIHGLGEHCNRYNHMAEYFAQHNLAMIGYDRRGHGQSEGKRGHTPSYDNLLDEVDQLLTITKERYPVAPIFMYGHSMGGNILLKHLISRNPRVKGAIASAPFIEFPNNPPSVLIFIGRVMRKIYPAFTQNNGLNADDISKNKKEVEKYKNDPLVHDKITSATGIGMIEVAKELESFAGDIKIPTLLMHGNEDNITAHLGSKKFAKRVQGKVTYKEWEGAFHEIHNEEIQRDVFDYAINWIRSCA